MIVGVLRESFPGERRVALIPALLPALIKARAEVLVEFGAGADAGFPDAEYEAKGARMAARPEVLSRADVILMVRTPGANPAGGTQDISALKTADSHRFRIPRRPQRDEDSPPVVFARAIGLSRALREPKLDSLPHGDVTRYKAALLAATSFAQFPSETAAGPSHLARFSSSR